MVLSLDPIRRIFALQYLQAECPSKSFPELEGTKQLERGPSSSWRRPPLMQEQCRYVTPLAAACIQRPMSIASAQLHHTPSEIYR
jgi:hypothetical protein